MATTPDVERIDIIEGPGLQFILDSLRNAVPRGDSKMVTLAIFNDVILYNEHGAPIVVRNFAIPVVGIRYLGNIADRKTRDEFIITVGGDTTFEGHYNTHTRKGYLTKLL